MRLIQISDCHLLDDPKDRLKNVSTHGSLRALLERCKNTEKKAGAYVLTGDLSQTGSGQSYKNMAQLLSLINKPMYALAGNHDDILEMREQMRKQVQCVHSADLGLWQLLLLNSKVIDEEHGHISEADLNWLKLWLQASGDKPTLIAVHHQPVAVGSAWIDSIRLDNGEELLETLAAFPQVKGLIFGHVHQEYDQQFQHIRILGCPSSCFQYAAGSDEFAIDDVLRPGYRWLELNDDGSLETGVSRLK